MNHSFNVDVAVECGVHAAILLENIAFWVLHHKANNTYFRDGKTWTYNTMKAFSELFPYMSFKQVRGALDRLKEAGFIEVGNYNKVGFDQTKWYTLTDKAVCLYGHLHLPYRANPIATEGKPIPIINTVINTDIMQQQVVAPKQRKTRTKKEFVPPTLAEIEAYVKERNNGVDARKFYDYYSAGNWHDGVGKPIKNWKQKMIANWENKNQQNTQVTHVSFTPRVETSNASIETEGTSFFDEFIGDEG